MQIIVITDAKPRRPLAGADANQSLASVISVPPPASCGVPKRTALKREAGEIRRKNKTTIKTKGRKGEGKKRKRAREANRRGVRAIPSSRRSSTCLS